MQFISDKTKNMIEDGYVYFMGPLLIERPLRYFHTNCEIFSDVRKNGDYGKKRKNIKTETGTPFVMEI